MHLAEHGGSACKSTPGKSVEGPDRPPVLIDRLRDFEARDDSIDPWVREPRYDMDASEVACHEAGHAVERYIVHGTTGAIRPAPLPGKEAGAESEPLPDDLRVADPLKPGETKLVEGPYSDGQRRRLEQEIQTTLAGSVAEGLVRGSEPLDVLTEPAQQSDWELVWGIASRLWPTKEEQDEEVARLAAEVEVDLDAAWTTLKRVAEAYEARHVNVGLDATEVAGVCRAAD
jgi:hypothetical protein